MHMHKILNIGDDTFEDLDEVVDHYIDPMVGHLKAMLNYHKFRKGKKAEVDELLRAEKLSMPARIAYSFGISHERPGTFILTYIRSSNPHHEYVGLYPKRFKFRKRMFEDIDRLVAYFQRHINDPIQESQSIRAVAASVPFQECSGDGNGWGGTDGGWRGSSRGELHFVETTMGVVEEEEGMVVVYEVDTQVGLQGHMEGVAEVEAHTTPIGKEMVAIHPTGVQKTRMEIAAGEVSQAPKCRIPLAVNRFLVAGAPVEVGLVAVVGPLVVVGAMQVMMLAGAKKPMVEDLEIKEQLKRS
ncbi:Transcription elongation factor SPT6-like protein [Drosera capensis]